MKPIQPLLTAILLGTALGVQAQAAPMAPAAAPPAAAVTAPINDNAFVKAAAQDGMAEIQMAQLAQQNASSSEVKQFAQELQSSHSASNERLKQLARSRDIKLPKDISKDDQQVKNELAKLSGSQFDQHFIQTQILDHEKAIALFQREAANGQSSELKAYAKSTLPHLQAHLEKAKQLAAQMGTSSR